MEVFPGISIEVDVRFGKPCITGTRIDVATVAGLIAIGETVETVASEYQLSVEQVRAAVADVAHVAELGSCTEQPRAAAGSDFVSRNVA